MKKYIILLLLSLFNLISYSQEIRPTITKTQQFKALYAEHYHTSKCPGFLIKTKPGTLRIRTYSNDCIQFTFITGHKFQVRLYTYYDLLENKLTKAVSLRYLL